MACTGVELIFEDNRKRSVPRPKMESSPYFDIPLDQRRDVTRNLIAQHPLEMSTLIDATLASWNDIFGSRIGKAQIGNDIRPAAQTMGFFLHELIPYRIAQMNPEWQRDTAVDEKDLHYIPDPKSSIEIKTSSHPKWIFGNRSAAQELVGEGRAKKAKSGYYLTVNFDSWNISENPQVRIIRFGWVDATDWLGQAAATGQNSSLSGETYSHQLAILYAQ